MSNRVLIMLLSTLICAATATAQHDTTEDSTRRVQHAPDVAVEKPTLPDDTAEEDSVRTATHSDAPSAPLRIMPAHSVLTRSSLTTVEYHHAAGVLSRVQGVREYSLGNFGQPLWVGAFASTPMQWRMAVNGSTVEDALTDMPHPYFTAIDDMHEIRVSPSWKAFWIGGAGAVLTADFIEKEWDALRPVTRLRYSQSANEYTSTDAMFTLNTSETENLYVAGTRTSIGSATSNEAARFANNRHEAWNIRLRYRKHYTSRLSARMSLQYNDDMTLLNGGIAPLDTDQSGRLSWPLSGSAPFSEEAFDPKSAILVNPTMFTHRQRYSGDITARLSWDRDSAHVTMLRLAGLSEVRRFRDRLEDIIADSLAEPRFNITDSWSRASIELHHMNDIEWATLTLSGQASPYVAEKGGAMFLRRGLNTMLRGKLELSLAGIHLAGLARLDRRWERSALSAGLGADITLAEGLAVWAGVSYSPRIYSLTEQWYRENGDAALASQTPLEDVRIAEAGLKADLQWLQADIRIFQRQSEQRLAAWTSPVADSVYGRYSLRFIEQGELNTIPGISSDVRVTFWRMHLDQQFSTLLVNEAVDGIPALPAPRLSWRAELYYLGSLIEGTLNLRVGGSLEYSSRYYPMTWHPMTGLFTWSVADGAWSYTDRWRMDAFLFATVKDRATIHVVLHNILDTRYVTTAMYPMFDRSMRIGVDWVFYD
jgi:hypothetical protein